MGMNDKDILEYLQNNPNERLAIENKIVKHNLHKALLELISKSIKSIKIENAEDISTLLELDLLINKYNFK